MRNKMEVNRRATSSDVYVCIWRVQVRRLQEDDDWNFSGKIQDVVINVDYQVGNARIGKKKSWRKCNRFAVRSDYSEQSNQVEGGSRWDGKGYKYVVRPQKVNVERTFVGILGEKKGRVALFWEYLVCGSARCGQVRYGYLLIFQLCNCVDVQVRR